MNPATSLENRLDYLDAARGLAAYWVLIFHVIHTHWGETPLGAWLCVLFNGGDAVSFFFVLSGLVLSLKYVQSYDAPFSYRKYFIARVFRLYPVFWFSLAICAFCALGLSLSSLRSMLTNENGFMTEAALIWGKSIYNGGDWTLTVEIICSLVLPLFMFACRAQPRYIWAVVLAPFVFPTYVNGFFVHFALGLALALNFDYLRGPDFKTSKIYALRWIWLPVCGFLFSWVHLSKVFPFLKIALEKTNHYTQHDSYTWSAFAAFGFLAYLFSNERLQKVFSLKPLVFLGRISYSLYLIHGVIIAYIVDKIYLQYVHQFPSNPILTIAALVAIATSLTIPAAALMYYFIEKPSINLGRKIAAHSSMKRD